MLRKIDIVIKKLEKILVIISWIVSILITMMIITDVFLRFFFNYPLPASWEISEVFIAFIIFFPLAYTLTIDGHVRVSFVKDRLPKKVQSGFGIFNNAISFVVCAIITYWAWLRFSQSLIINEEILAAIQIPWWLGKMAMPIGMGVFAIRYLLQVFAHFSRHKQSILSGV